MLAYFGSYFIDFGFKSEKLWEALKVPAITAYLLGLHNYLKAPFN